jgi:hypothetical protein
MRIIVDIDDATGAVTITPEPQDPEAAIANPEAVAAEPGKERRDFHTETGARYSYDPETHTLTGYSHRSNPDDETVFLTMDVDPSGVTVGPAYSGWRWQVRPPSAPQSGVIAFNEESHDEAVAFAEWLESVGGPKRDRGGSEPALDTVTLALPDPVLTVDEAQRALGMAAMKIKLPGLLTGVHVVVDMTGAETTTVMAVSEIVTRLCKRGAKSIEFVTDNNGVAARIEVTLIVNKIATLLPVTLVDNSVEPEPEPDPERSVPHNATIGDTTYEWQPAVSELVIDHEDGKGWTIEGVIPSLYVWNVGCEHKREVGECDRCVSDVTGVHVPTRHGVLFVPVARIGGAPSLASWLAEVFEKGKA